MWEISPAQQQQQKRHTNASQKSDRYCSELYNYKANGDPSVLNSPQTEDDHPILHREVEAAVQPLKKGTSAGVDNSQQNWSEQVEK